MSGAGSLVRLGLQSGLVLAILGAETAVAQERLVLVGATLLDGTGAPPITGSRIIIADGRFVCVSGPDGCPSEAGDRALLLEGRWIIPGLIDTHVHLPIDLAPEGLFQLQRLRFALGITAVRDADSRSVETILAARPAAEAASRPIPRLVVAARVTPEYAERLGAALGAPLVERLAAMGVDQIKIKEPFEDELWREEIRAARAAGLGVYGHTWGGPPPATFLREALQEGISGISHTMAFAVASQPRGRDLAPPDSVADPYAWSRGFWLTAEPAMLDTLLSEMIAHGAWLEPTLAAEYHWGRALAPPDAARYLGLPRSLREILGLGGFPSPPRPAYPETWARQSALVANFISRGGMVVAGSDGVAPGIDLHEEIRLIGEVAGSPMAGLLAATRDAARAVGRPDLGTIEAGKLADAVVYPADPLGAPGATLAAELILKGGTVHLGDSLRAEFRRRYHDQVRDTWRGRVVRGAKLLGIILAAVLAVILIRRRRRA